ncbi:MAG: sensor histidine kinase [Candidatus Thorarchaeota archaeon]
MLYYILMEGYDTPIDLFYFEVTHDFHGSAYLIPFIYAALTTGLASSIVVWTGCFGAALPRIVHYSLGVNAEIYNTLFFILPLMLAVVILLELRWREKHAQLAAERERERSLHIDHVFRAQESERRRIAQGLHDDAIQRLMSIAFLADNLSEDSSSTVTNQKSVAADIREESLRLADDLRRLSYDLRPSILDSLGLVAAVDWLLQRLQHETAIRVAFYTAGSPTRLDPLVETKSFRIVQEALNNVKRHSHATEVTVCLRFSPTSLIVKISDNGVGFAVDNVMLHAAQLGHLGLLGMRERAESMGGSLTITSTKTNGTGVCVRIPLAHSDTQQLE